MFLIPLILIIALFYGFNSNRDVHFPHSYDRSYSIVKERYARGEITREEYLRILDILR